MLIRDDRKEGRVVVRRLYFDIIVEESWKRKHRREIVGESQGRNHGSGITKPNYEVDSEGIMEENEGG